MLSRTHLTPLSVPATRRTGSASVLRPTTLLLTIGSLPLPTGDTCTG
jgi:hypothetical protein